MKKWAAFLLALCLTTLSGCTADGRAAKTEQEMAELARNSIPISGIETAELQFLSRVDVGDDVLLILSVGDEAQSRSYFPASYRRKGNSYYLEHVGKTGLYRASSPGCWLYHWMDGTVFFIDNENCAAVQVTGEEESRTIPVTSHPFAHYEADPSADPDGEARITEYLFLDEDGQELR